MSRESPRLAGVLLVVLSTVISPNAIEPNGFLYLTFVGEALPAAGLVTP
jgi:hypothetical protein